MADVTQILSQIESGDPSAAAELLPLVYQKLRKLAAAKLAQEKPGQTLHATALVHDAYIRLVDVEKAPYWNSRGHFFRAAAEAGGENSPGATCPRVSRLKVRQTKRLGFCAESSPENLQAVDGGLEWLKSHGSHVPKLDAFSGLKYPSTLWEPAGGGGFTATLLETLIPSKPAWKLVWAFSINDDGCICSGGRKFVNGKYTWTSVLLVPNR